MAVYNVMTGYGAANNGVTDDTTSLNNAINAANGAGGGVVYFPSGAGYRITSTLNSPASGVTLEGEGWRASVIRPAGSFDTIYINGAEEVAVLRLGIRPLANQASGNGLYIHNGASVIVDEVKVYADGGNRPFTGIKVDGSGTYKIWISRTEIDACTAAGFAIGTYGVVEFPQGIYLRQSIVGAGLSNGIEVFCGGGNVFTDCEVLANVGNGVVVVPGPGQRADLIVDSCLIDTNGGHGIDLNTVDSGVIFNVEVRDTWSGNNGNLEGHLAGSAGIHVNESTNVQRLFIHDNHVAVNGGDGMSLFATQSLFVHGNQLNCNAIQRGPSAGADIYVAPCNAYIMVSDNFADGTSFNGYPNICAYGFYLASCPNFKMFHGNTSLGHTVADYQIFGSISVNTDNA